MQEGRSGPKLSPFSPLDPLKCSLHKLRKASWQFRFLLLHSLAKASLGPAPLLPSPREGELRFLQVPRVKSKMKSRLFKIKNIRSSQSNLVSPQVNPEVHMLEERSPLLFGISAQQRSLIPGSSAARQPWKGPPVLPGAIQQRTAVRCTTATAKDSFPLYNSNFIPC